MSALQRFRFLKLFLTNLIKNISTVFTKYKHHAGSKSSQQMNSWMYNFFEVSGHNL